ncbi:Phage tail fiber protein [Candidatus Hepatincola sp. Pdp]
MSFEIVYTDKGLEKLVLAENGTPLVLEKFAVGDGENAPETSQTALQNEKWRGYINKVEVSSTTPTNLLVTCVIPAQIPITEAFYIRELGLFDTEEELIAIAKVPDSYYAQSNNGIASEKLYNIVLSISNTAEVTLELDTTILATQESVKELDTKVNNTISEFQRWRDSQKGVLSKLSDGNFSLTTKCKADTGQPAELYDGLTIHFNVPIATAVWNWQDIANPTLTVDDLGSSPLINGLFYRETELQALDRNTICSAKQYVEYVEDIDSWLLYHANYTSTQIYYKTTNKDLAGFLRLSGQRLSSAGTNIIEQYPLYKKTPWIYQDSADDSTQVINLTSTAIVAAGGETPYGIISEGQIKNITGTVSSGEDSKQNDVATGAFYFTGDDNNVGRASTDHNNRLVAFDASRVVKTGNETLTRRFGLYPFLKL